ncbi:MAG: YigZ family protein, partial [Christensenellaceae bacterium]|nr:YigZ family protein [Christensenellaceae bacterium]
KHRDATHNCHAYIIGEKADIMRYSDDGEPTGTAGMPMLDILKQSNIVNCVVVATRYFGGILLGAGGLIRAYRKTCSIGIKAAQVAVMTSTVRVLIEVDYPFWDKLLYNLNLMPLIVEGTDYGVNVTTKLLIKTENLESSLESINNITDGKFEQLVDEEFYYPWNDENITIEE